MKLTLKLHNPQAYEKDILIIGESAEHGGICILVDYDDVDQENVLKLAKEIVRRVNTHPDND